MKFSRKFLPLAAILFSLTFIVISVYLIVRVNTLRQGIEYRVECINTANRISDFNFLLKASSSDINNSQAFILGEKMDSIAKVSAKYEELELVTQEIYKLKKSITSAQRSTAALEARLMEIQLQTRKVVKNCRTALSEDSVKLNEYWSLTHFIIILACLLTAILIFLFIYNVRVKERVLVERAFRYRLIDSAIDCIITCDKDGKIIEFNRVAEQTFGYKYKEVKGKDVSFLYKDKQGLSKVVEALYGEDGFKGEIVNKHRNGELFISFLSANFVYDDNGEIVGSMGISRDITDDKNKKQEYSKIINNASDVIYTIDNYGICNFVNDAVLEYGYQKEDIIGNVFSIFIHESEQERVAKFYLNQIQNKTEETYLEFKSVKKDGSIVWVGQTVKVLKSPIDSNSTMGFLGIVRNIEKQKKFEQGLIESERKYRELFQNSTDVIQSTKPNGEFIYVNEAWKSLLGYKNPEELNLLDLMDKESKANYGALLNELNFENLKHKENVSFKLKTKQGKYLNMQGSMSAKRKGDKILSIQSFVRNVTQQKLAEEQLKKSEANFQLIAKNISDTFFLYNSIERKYEYMSPNCTKVLGPDPEFFYAGNSHLEAYVHPADQDVLNASMQLISKGVNYTIEYRVLIDGKIRWVNERSFPIKDANNKIYGCCGVCRDITSKVETREQIKSQVNNARQSLDYMKVMQTLMLPEDADLGKLFKEHFVFYKPKENLSADFYFADEFTIQGQDFLVFGVADCIGNGVLGGLLSSLCSNLLKDLIESSNSISPAFILEEMRSRLMELLKLQDSSSFRNGMEISLCFYNKGNGELSFSAASHSMIVIRAKEAKKYSSPKQIIGFNLNKEAFSDQIIKIEEGDSIYLCSDGFQNQFGGFYGKKFSTRQLKDMLIVISELSMKKQLDNIQKEFDDWRGNEEQVDDITLLGVKI